MSLRVPFLDLGAASRELETEQRAAIERVVASGWYVLGPELERFEVAFAAAAGASHAVGVGNGLDALRLTLVALGIGPGDEVIVPSHTFVATWLAVAATGARIVPVEPGPHAYLLGPDAVAAAITSRTAAIVPVHLYGEPADMPALARLAARHSLALVADAAQAHGARVGGHAVGAWGDASTWSFYPAKNLGALGDGGAITTDDPELAARLRRLRNYGSETKYVHLEAGVNSRLDELQAAILGTRLTVLGAWNERRRAVAERYAAGLGATGLHLPAPADGHAWHLYVVRTARRDALAAQLAAAGIGTLVHYPVPCHRQGAFGGDAVASLELPAADRLAAGVLSLPIGPHLSADAADEVIAAVQAATMARAA